MKKFLLTVSLAIGSLVLFNSCSKDKNPLTPGGPSATKNIKFTFSTQGLILADGDAASFSLAGSDGSANMTNWKVNGVVRNNEQGFIITEDDLAAGTVFVVESVKPLMTASISISAQNFEANTYKLNYKAEVNGTVQNDVSETITTSNAYIRSFTY